MIFNHFSRLYRAVYWALVGSLMRRQSAYRNKGYSQELIRQHVRNWQEETAQHETNLHDFLSWFDAAESPEQSYMTGWWDFSFHILKPKLIALLGEPFEKTALEIGYGAGRLLVPACHYFRHCIGIDIHPFKEKVEEIIRRRGVTNFALYQTDGSSIPLDNESVDLVYSFIVLQHLPTIEALQDYISESYRALKPGGTAILYMGFLPGRFKRYVDLSSLKVDSTRQVTLLLTTRLASELLRDAGFMLVEIKRSQKKPWLPKMGGSFMQLSGSHESVTVDPCADCR